MNLTPDSFSDGDLNLNAAKVKDSTQKIVSSFDIVDFGAQSTAPSSLAINENEEYSRYERLLLPLLEGKIDFNEVSFDTFRVNVFSKLCDLVKKKKPLVKIIFNDVSGCLDDDLYHLLKTKRDFSYVYSFNNVPKRSLTPNHMDYCVDDLVFNETWEHFLSEAKKLESFYEKLIIDPCFGFSKTYEQNHLLFNRLSELDTFKKVMIGVSKKSLLRVPKDLSPRDDEDLVILEQIHAAFIYKYLHMLSDKKTHTIFRSHQIEPIYSALVTKELLS